MAIITVGENIIMVDTCLKRGQSAATFAIDYYQQQDSTLMSGTKIYRDGTKIEVTNFKKNSNY